MKENIDVIKDNYVSIERLKQIKEIYDKREGRKYPYSNQIIVCGIVTEDRNLAINFMKDKNVVEKFEGRNEIKWLLDNGEYWVWKHWNENCRGQRFYKLAIDRLTDRDLFEYVILPSCGVYCCSVEII